MPYPRSNSSGIGPQGSGAEPTPFEQLWQANNQQSSMQLMQWAALSDPTVNATTRLAADMMSHTARNVGGRRLNESNFAGNNDNPGYAYKDGGLRDMITGGTTYDQFLATPAGSAIRTGMAAAALNTNVFGGSIGQMAFGIQQMMGSGGMTLDGGRFGGAGFVTDMTSQYMMDSVRNTFFDPTSGLANAQARGMDKDDFGDAGFAMSRRGMFAGMDAGGMKRINSKAGYEEYIGDLEKNKFTQVAKEARTHLNSLKEGDDIDIQAFNPNTDVFAKVNEMFKGAAKTISEFRDIFGPGLTASAAIEEAEKITGMSYADAGAGKAASAKLHKLKTISQVNGMDLHSMLTMDQTMAVSTAELMAQNHGGLPSDYARLAAASTPAIWEQSTVATQNRAESIRQSQLQGLGHVSTVSQDAVASLQMRAMTSILAESPYAVEAMYYAENNSDMSPEDKAAIRSKVKALGGAGTVEARDKINNELKEIMVKNGIEPGEMMNFYEGDVSALLNATSQGTNQAIMDMTAQQESARMIEETLPATLRAINLQERYGVGDTDKSQELLKTMFKTMDDEEVLGIMTGLKTGDDDAVNKIIESQDAYLREAGMGTIDPETKKYVTGSASEEFKKLFGEVYAEGEAATAARNAKFGTTDEFDMYGAIKDTRQAALANPSLINRVTIAQSAEQRKQATEKLLLNKSLGNQEVRKEGIAEQIARGFFGEGEVTDSAVLTYMEQDAELKNEVKRYDITNASAGNLTEEQINELGLQLGDKPGLDALLGITRDKNNKIEKFDDVKGMLSTPEGAGKLIDFIDASGVAWDQENKDGQATTLRIGDKAKSDVVRTKADELNRARAALSLSGITGKDQDAEIQKLDDLAEAEISNAVSKLNASSVTKFHKDLTDGNTDVTDAAVAGMANGDDAAIQAIIDSGSQETIMNQLVKRGQQLSKEAEKAGPGEKGDELRKKARNYKDAVDKIGGSGEEYVARIAVVMDGTGWGDLYKKPGQ